MSALSQILCPTLIVAADENPVCGLEKSAGLVLGIPNVKPAVVHGSGHMIPLEAPQKLAAIVSGGLTVGVGEAPGKL